MNNVLRSFSIHRVDFLLLLPALALVAISLATLYSLDSSIFKQQLMALLLGLVVYFLFLNVNMRYLGAFSKQMYIVILVSLGLKYLST